MHDADPTASPSGHRPLTAVVLPGTGSDAQFADAAFRAPLERRGIGIRRERHHRRVLRRRRQHDLDVHQAVAAEGVDAEAVSRARAHEARVLQPLAAAEKAALRKLLEKLAHGR